VKRRAVIALFLLLLAAAPVAAGTLPPPQRFVLANGITVLLHTDNELPLVSFRLLLPGAGTASEKTDGLADLAAGMLLKGTSTRSAAQLAEELDRLGVTLRCTAQEEYAEMSGGSLSENFPRLLALAADCLAAPAFAAEEFAKEKQRRIDAIRQVQDEPSQAVRQYFRKTYFAGHPLGSLKGGSEAALQPLSAEDARGFFRRHWLPSAAARPVLAVCGRIDAPGLKRLLASTLGRWSRPAGEEAAVVAALPPLPARRGRTCVLIDKPDATQAYFMLGAPGLAFGDAASPQAEVMNTLFGGRFTSWLNSELRIKRGLTYGAHSALQSWRPGGIFTVSSYTRNDKIGEMLAIVFELLARARQEGFSAVEVESARNYILGQFPPSLESLGSKTRAYSELFFYGRGCDYYDGLMAGVAQAAAPEVNRFAAAALPAEDWVLVVVGRAGDIRRQLEPFGPFNERTIRAGEF
jgi:predicted Zn-dependent peptidase